jgi:hypothetical protein
MMMITGRFIIFFRSVVSGLLIMLRRSNAVAAMQSQQYSRSNAVAAMK